MFEDIVNWWKTLWVDHKPAATAVAGFVSAFLLFLVKDLIWQPRYARAQKRIEFWQKQLDVFYAPLYALYREAYVRYYDWRRQNPDTRLKPQPFFVSLEDETEVAKLFAESPGYASQLLLRCWSDFSAADEPSQKHQRRHCMIVCIVREYNQLRKHLDLAYDSEEIQSGEFRGLLLSASPIAGEES